MNLIRKIRYISLGLFWLANIIIPLSAQAYSLSAVDVYRQAYYRNQRFMNWLSNYNHAIDVQNRLGDTAYCIALKYNDTETQKLLRDYGADVNHDCVKRFRQNVGEQGVKTRTVQQTSRYPVRTTSVAASTGNNYLWWGLGALAVGGGVAAIASSGGGGGSHSSHSSNNNEEHSDSSNSNTPEEGNTGNDSNQQDNHGDSSDDVNQGDDNDDINSGGGTTNGSGTEDNEENNGMTSLSAAAFKTGEYNKGNFLNGINAATAYSQIYRKDANGNIVSHQITSDDALRKIRVGVIDTGVFAHGDLEDKIVGSYDANVYKGEETGSNVWGYARGNIHYYVFCKDAKYYFMAINVGSEQLSVTPFANLSKTDLINLLKGYSLSFNNFTLMNGNVNGGPGVSLDGFDPDIENDVAKVNTWWNIITELSHGTHVAGIIAANKNDGGMHGVAFENAEIYAGSWDFEQNLYPMVEDMINHDVKVLNNSWGMEVTNQRNASKPEWLFTHDTDFLRSYAYAAKNGAVWVQATGNDGLMEAGVQVGVGKLNNQLSTYGYDGPDDEYKVPFVAVAALDPSTAIEGATSGRIADYSNWCGSAKEYCLAAPGSAVASTSAIKNGYLTMDGTSMATPVVSGSIALLLGYYPYLKPQHVAWLLLETANRSGLYEDSEIYGRGVLDLERAVQPVGDLVLPTTSGFSNMKTAANSRLLLSTATQSTLKKNLPKTVTAFDELHRPFEYDTSKLVSATHASNANFRNEVSHAAISKPSKVIKDEKHGFTFSSQEALGKNGQEHLSEVSVLHETEGGSMRFYYAENSQYTNAESAVKPTANPYMAMNEAYGVENTLNLSDVSRLKLSLQTGENGLYGRDYEQDHQSFDERAYGMGAEYSFDLTDYLELSALGGLLYEEDAMLGMNGRGGFAIKDGSTYYAGIKAMFNVTPNFSILAAYYRGYTEGRDTSLLSMSNLETESYMIAGEYKLDKENKVGLSLRSPMSVVRGKSSFRYASGRDNYSDTIYMRKLTSSMKPAAKEYDLGVYYIGEPKEDLNITGKIEARFNADGEKGVTDYLGIMGISKSF